MIVVDTSALVAILAREPTAQACAEIMRNAEEIVMSAGNLSEALIVASRRGLTAEMRRLIDGALIRIIDVTPDRARRAAEAYRRWGKGFHAAGLNYGDCFAYATAEEFACPLLFVGEDFARTDLAPALKTV